MKSIRLLVFLSVFAVPAGPVFAQSQDAVWDSVYDRWDVTISAAGGLSFGFDVAGVPGIELIVISKKVEEYVPIDLGVGIKSLITLYEESDAVNAPGWLHTGIGLTASAHLSFNNLEYHVIPELENFDFFVSAGPVYDIISYRGSYVTSPPPIPKNSIGMFTSLGAKYFLLDWLWAGIELFTWSFSPGISAGIGVTF